MQVLSARPRGFCAGVVRAIDTVRQVLQQHGAPVYVYHQIVHNQRVIEELAAEGAVFVQAVDQIPAGAVTILSAHGVSHAILDACVARQLVVIDATCPLVAKVHEHAEQYSRAGNEVLIIGHRGHDEVVGIQGRITGPCQIITTPAEARAVTVDDPTRVAYVTQTTLSVDDARQVIDALLERLPQLHGPQLDDICYATQNRQQAVRQLARWATLILVVGANNSSNANRLREVAAQSGVAAQLVQDASELQQHWLDGHRHVGVTAGASTPEVLVQEVWHALSRRGYSHFSQMAGADENVVFAMPAGVDGAELIQLEA